MTSEEGSRDVPVDCQPRSGGAGERGAGVKMHVFVPLCVCVCVCVCARARGRARARAPCALVGRGARGLVMVVVVVCRHCILILPLTSRVNKQHRAKPSAGSCMFWPLGVPVSLVPGPPSPLSRLSLLRLVLCRCLLSPYFVVYLVSAWL